MRQHDGSIVVDQLNANSLRETRECLRNDFLRRLRLVMNASKTVERFRALWVAAELRRVVGLQVSTED